MTSDVREEHRWLQQLVGEWVFEGEATMGPDQPLERMTGRERVRMLGETWAACEIFDGDAADTPAISLLTLGFDPARARFVGAFVSGSMTHLWTYDGTLDAAGRALSLDTMGPDADRPGLVPYRDVIEIASPDARTLRSEMRGPDGDWRTVMTSRYRRVG